MATSIYLPQRSKVRSNKVKAKKEVIFITAAEYFIDFIISLRFNTGESRNVDFLPLFHRYVKGANLRYLSIKKFKNFTVQDGNIFWGKNEDVIFTIDSLYDFNSKQKDEILYVIK